jgi:hypothetical protein
MGASEVSLAALVTACAVIVGLSGPLARAGEPHGPRAFVQSVYARYAQGSDPQTLDAGAPALFAADLLSLIREDERRAHGEAGFLDHDPICSCQDWTGLKVTAIHVTPNKDGHAKAAVDFTNGGQAVHVVLSLVQEDGQWRISDVREPEVPSIRRYLESALKTAAVTKP